MVTAPATSPLGGNPLPTAAYLAYRYCVAVWGLCTKWRNAERLTPVLPAPAAYLAGWLTAASNT